MSHLNNGAITPQKQPLEEWVVATFEAVLTAGKVEPRQVLSERAHKLFTDFKWPEFKRYCEECGTDLTPVEHLATAYPNLPQLLKTEQGIKVILDYPEQHPEEMVDFHQKLVALNGLVLSISMGKLCDPEEIWHRFRSIMAGNTATGEAPNAK